MKPLLLRIHRWTTLVFALPLLVIVATGLILSFEPLLQLQPRPAGTLNEAQLNAAIARQGGTVRRIVYRTHENSLEIRGANRDQTAILDASTLEPRAALGPLANFIAATRTIHQHLIFDLEELVHASTYAMLILIALGVLMGLPRFANTVSGWHKGFGWLTLPVLVLSPLTGLLLAYGVSFGANPRSAPASGAPVSMVEAVSVIAKAGDLNNLVWLRSFGPRIMVRMRDNGSLTTYQVSRDGLTPAPTNWPRAFHEGTWGGSLGATLNIVVSLAMLGLLATGLFIWQKRTFRRRPPRPIVQEAI